MPHMHYRSPRPRGSFSSSPGGGGGNWFKKIWRSLKSFYKRHKKPINKTLKRLLLLGVICFILFSIYVLVAFAWYSRDLPDPNKVIERNISQSTKIYDRTGEHLLYDVHGDEKRTLVKLEDIPDMIKWATISAEDKNFYEHHGFSPLAIFKGAVIDPLMGKRARGGSTLTQQFVKNSLLTNERSISRKIKELVLSYKIENMFSKDEILQMYLNEIPYGSVVYGIESAAQTFFGKSVQELTLAEITVLSGLPQSPTYYSPYGSNFDALKNRQKYVLDQMVANDYISREEADEAFQEELVFTEQKNAIQAPHFVMYVKELLAEELGEDLLETGGLKVLTTLDMDKQRIAEEAVENGVSTKGEYYEFHNAALLSLDPRNGQILAMVGSRDYFDRENDGNVNVTLRPRQPGSSMKPLVYTATFQKGYTPNTVLYDTVTTFKTDTKDYRPLNYDLREHGPVTIRKALQGSLNIPAVKATYLVGIEKVLDFLELMGYNTFEDRHRFGLSIVLGGGEVTLLEHAAAYGALANGGVYHEPSAILRVEDSRGNELMRFEENERKVMEPNYAYIISNVLSDNGARAYAFGLQNHLTLGERPAAAKTGTTNDYRDAWTMGYTPSLVAGVWAGNNDNSEMKRGATGGEIAAPIWNEYMRRALEETEIEYFPNASIPQTGKPILDGDVMPEVTLKIDKFTGKLATDLTPESYIEEKKYRQAHSILHYVYKDNPRGTVPEDPASADPAYQYWESGIQEWLKKKAEEEGESDIEISEEEPPTEYDDAHTEENRPTIFINSPDSNERIDSETLTARVNVSAPRGIGRVEYYLDDKLIQTVTGRPYSLNYSLSSYFGKGYHTLRVVAYDDIDNSNEATVEINITADIDEPSVIWRSPRNHQIFRQADFPVTIRVTLTDLMVTKQAKFIEKKKGESEERMISTVISPDSQDQVINWGSAFERGEYELIVEITDMNNNKYRSLVREIVVN